MKVKDIDALREQISHDPREEFTKHQVWLFVSEHNKTTPTFDAVPKSVLQDIKAELNELKSHYMPSSGVEWGIKMCLEIIDKYESEIEPQERNNKE